MQHSRNLYGFGDKSGKHMPAHISCKVSLFKISRAQSLLAAMSFAFNNLNEFSQESRRRAHEMFMAVGLWGENSMIAHFPYEVSVFRIGLAWPLLTAFCIILHQSLKQFGQESRSNTHKRYSALEIWAIGFGQTRSSSFEIWNCLVSKSMISNSAWSSLIYVRKLHVTSM